MSQIYKQSAYVSKLDFYFGHFLLIVNAYKGGSRSEDSNFQGGGGGGKFFSGLGFLRFIPIETLYHLWFSGGGGGGGGSGHPPPMAPFLHTQRWSGPEQ